MYGMMALSRDLTLDLHNNMPRIEPCETPSSACVLAAIIVDSLSRNVSMADPLSIAASTAGLLSVAVKVGNIITSFISSANDAPESARDIH